MTMRRHVVARNDAVASENKIHDDAVARLYGFGGGLVPGVTVYGLMTWAPVSKWGEPWLERGTMDVRFTAPVYDGDDVEIVTDDVDGNELLVHACTGGSVRATSNAAVPLEPAPAPSRSAFRVVEPPGRRPPASAESLAPGTDLVSLVRRWGPAEREEQRTLLGDDLEIYDDLRIAHPGGLLRAANEVLSRRVRLGPWMHVGSTVANLGVVHDGDTVTTVGRVTDCYERKGHRFVELDALSCVEDRRVLSVHHVAIYEPRRAG
jgi:acyl dehydratase